MSNQELQKTKIWKRIIDNICGANLVDMQDKFDKEIRFLLCVIDIFSKYAWAVPLKDKKGITTTNVNKIQHIKNT